MNLAVLGFEGTSTMSTAEIRAALDNNCAVSYGGLKAGIPLSKYDIVGNHAYPIVDYYWDASANDYRFILKNPWGYREPTPVLGEDLYGALIADSSETTAAWEVRAGAPALGAALSAGIAAKPISLAAFQPRFESVSSQERINETAARADVIASLFDESSTRSAAPAKFASTENGSDWLSGGVLTAFSEKAESIADFDAMRHLLANKKANPFDAAVDAVLAEEEEVLVLL